MAKFENIVVADSGAKLVLFPRKKDEGERVTLTTEQSAKVREHVDASAKQNDSYATHATRLAGNKRVGMYSGNGMVAGIRAAIAGESTATPERKPVGFQQDASNVEPVEVSVEDAMIAAEHENARRTQIAAIKRSNMSLDAKSTLLSLIQG